MEGTDIIKWLADKVKSQFSEDADPAGLPRPKLFLFQWFN